MAFINDLNINITLATRPLTVQGFSRPLILGKRTAPHALIGHYGEYSDLTSMVTAGFTSDDPEYKMAAKIFGQTPRLADIAVHICDDGASAPASVTGSVNLSLGHDWSLDSEKFAIRVNGGIEKIITLDSACADITEVLTEINDGFTTAGINALVEAVASGNNVKIQTKTSGADKSIVLDDETGALATLGIAEGTYVGGSVGSIATALDTLIQTRNNWYGLFITERDNASLHAAGDWALGNEKFFVGCSADPAALDGRNNIREAYLIHNDAANFPEAAWAGMCFPQAIGTITWKWKTPTGVVASNFNLTELGTIRAGNGQTLSERSGVVYADEGITTGGEYIDVVMSRDYVKARLGEAIFATQIRSPKVPFDNSGAAMLEAPMRDVFRQCGKQTIIAKAVSEADKKKSDEGEYMYTVTIPERSEVPDNDRAARKWSGIEFGFTIAGAVHAVDVSGTITI